MTIIQSDERRECSRVRHDGDVEIDPLIYGYKRGGNDPVGALRTSFIESVSLDQLDGGKFQILARTSSGYTTMISEILPNLASAQDMLEGLRLFLGREGPMPEMPSQLD